MASKGTVVPVRIETRVTELGTLEVWCVSRDGANRWKLELNIRETTPEVSWPVSSRYLIGIDLGTTNSVVAYIDTQNVADGGSPIRVFPVPQLVAHGEVCTLPTLPSFLYFPTKDELSAGAVSATWDEDPPMVTGVHAREQGALVPSRQVSSAKSWLSYSGVDRHARILPPRLSPTPRRRPVRGDPGAAATHDFSGRSVRALPHASARCMERCNGEGCRNTFRAPGNRPHCPGFVL